MKIWILEACHFAEGSTVIGVFAAMPTPTQAREAMSMGGLTDEDFKSNELNDPNYELSLKEWSVGSTDSIVYEDWNKSVASIWTLKNRWNVGYKVPDGTYLSIDVDTYYAHEAAKKAMAIVGQGCVAMYVRPSSWQQDIWNG